MRKPQSDALAFSLLLICCVLVTWLGIAGPIVADGFWSGLEKWQTLLAAFVALIAAYYAARPVYRQLGEQRRQSAAAAVTMIVKAAVALEAERNIARTGRDDLYVIDQLLYQYDEGNLHDIYISWPNRAYELIEEINKVVREIRKFSERNPETTPLQTSRLFVIDALEQLVVGIRDLIFIMRQNTSGVNFEDGEEEIPDIEHKARRASVEMKRDVWIKAEEQLYEALSKEISRVWQRIRELERIAIGGSAA